MSRSSSGTAPSTPLASATAGDEWRARNGRGRLRLGRRIDDRLLGSLADVIVNDLELASRVRASTDGDTTTVTVIGSRVGTTELFDHPVASVVGVGLARERDAPVTIETAVENGKLVVTATPTASR
ncbi:MAG: hypothetical protein U5K28_05185 [Halobacteriales archaeon]|nr:hypothetical protein [Halobacteriales archaeon]